MVAAKKAEAAASSAHQQLSAAKEQTQANVNNAVATIQAAREANAAAHAAQKQLASAKERAIVSLSLYFLKKIKKNLILIFFCRS